MTVEVAEPTLHAAHDLAHLPRYTAAARIQHHNNPTPPFTLTTLPLPPVRPRRQRHAAA